MINGILNLCSCIMECITRYGNRQNLASYRFPSICLLLSFFLAILSRSSFDNLMCVGWLNFEFSKREKHSGWAIKTIYKKLNRGMLKHIPLNQ